METKLTLRVNKTLIDRAKKYARAHDTSLSRLIGNYLSAITEEGKDARHITPLVLSLSGVVHILKGEDLKKKYHSHLDKKYS